MIILVKGDLFSAPKDSIIIHACNTRGAWGAGIARQFAKRYPEAYKFYNRMCLENGANLLGSCLLIDVEDHTIGCLFTSSGYGSKVDDEQSILDNTFDAIDDLIFQNVQNKPLHMCKINSGLFGVDWELTQEVLEKFDEKFTVYEL